jgi:hypothetical protein
MIRTPTVFVLGAGASVPYGFPPGLSLANEVCSRLKAHPYGENLRELFGADLVEAFAEQFVRSGQYSLDAFVEGRPEFQQIARVAVVQELMPREIDASLMPTSDQDDWYRYLFSKIIPAATGAFTNQLQVITFNFDRSFERRLFIALKARYDVADSIATELALRIPVLHVHGDLGAPAWLHKIDDNLAAVAGESALARHYQPDVYAAAELRGISERISLISDSIPTKRIQIAREWLNAAQVICFLGFGYHPINLERLAVGSIFPGKTVRGTAMGISSGELDAIRRAFPDSLGPHFFTDEKRDTKRFLAETNFIHD